MVIIVVLLLLAAIIGLILAKYFLHRRKQVQDIEVTKRVDDEDPGKAEDSAVQTLIPKETPKEESSEPHLSTRDFEL